MLSMTGVGLQTTSFDVGHSDKGQVQMEGRFLPHPR